MKSLLLFLSLGATVAAAPNHALFSAVLATHVKDGRVDYHTLKADPRLPQYLDQLAATDPATLASDQERLALWLNAYNAYTLKLIIDREPLKSITELGTGGVVLGSLLKTTAWDIRFATVGGKKITLNEIEHEMIRGLRFEKSFEGDTTFAATFVFSVAIKMAINAIAATTGWLKRRTRSTGDHTAAPKSTTDADVTATPMNEYRVIAAGRPKHWPMICARWLTA